jgi:chemotaxis signal transduction protein
MVLTTAIADDAAAPAPAMSQWVVFRCGGDRFGVPLERVREIVGPRPITRLPGPGAQVCGLAGVRGRVVTVVDFGVLLRGRSAADGADYRLLLIDVKGRRIGAVVDEVMRIAPALVAPVGPHERAIPAVTGAGHIEDGTFAALDPELLLARLLP